MKILHTADWHLGSYIGPQLDDPYKRMENTIKCLNVLVETARQEQPDIILVAGDIFHAGKTWSERCLIEVRTAADYLRALAKTAPVAVLYGTPTHENLQSHYALEEMLKKTVHDIHFFTEPGIKRILNAVGDPIQIAGLPGFDKGHFRAQFPGLSAEEENQVFTQQLAQIVRGLSAQLDPNIPSVLMAHHTVVGCELDNGTHLFQANEVVLDAATLDNSAFDLVCLGHIHKAQRVEACSKPVYYAGSIDAFTFNDEVHGKGFWTHLINENWQGEETYQYIGDGYTVGSTFFPTPAREFLTCRWDQQNVETAISYLGESPIWLLGTQIKDKVIRILYTCDSETEKALDKKKLERDLYAAGAYYVSEIRPEKITAAVNRERMHEKMTVLDCTERYIQEKLHLDVHSDEFGQLINLAISIFHEAQASSPVGSTSGLFLPVEIEVRNYRSYAEEKLSFQDIFFAMVNGINGSGKSSLFMDAITDCLYEETREKELTGWIRNGEKSGSISFTFSLGDDLWRVTRTRQRSGKATLALAKFEYQDMTVDGEWKWQDHSCERMTDTQQKIIDLLGMDCDTFQSCVLIMQDRYGKFMEASKDDRMAVLANLLGLGIYDELAKITKDKLTDANRDVKTHKTEIEGLETEIAAEDGLHTEMTQIQTQLNVAADDLQESKDELAELQSKLGAIEGYVREAAELEKELKQKTDSYIEKTEKKADLQGRVVETESFLQNEQNILDRCAELDAARLEIAAMDGKLQLLNDKQQRCRKLNQDLSAAQQFRKNTANTISAINDSLKDKERLEKIVDGSTVEHDLEECEKKALEHRELEKKRDAASANLKLFDMTSQTNIDRLKAKIDSLLSQAKMLDNSGCIDSEKADCRFLQSAKDAKKTVEQVQCELDAMVSKQVSEGKQLENELFDIKAMLSNSSYDSILHNVLLQDVKTFRSAKDQLAKLSANAATADALKKQDAETVIKIQEYWDELEGISGEIAGLEKETGKISELNPRVRELTPYEQMKMQLPKAKQFVESAREAIRQLEADLAELSLAIGKANKQLGELAGFTADRGMISTNKLGAEQRINILESILSTLNQQVGTINAQLQTIDGKKAFLLVVQKKLQQSAKQAAQLQVLSEAFSQDGIPYQIIRDIVPELEAAANEILGQMTGGRMRLEFITEKVLKSNKAKEIATLEIIIIDIDNGILPYLSRSGGQKVRAALAVNFALANIKASRVGLQLGMMFVDEPPFLDADGVEAYCAALEIQHNKCPDMRLVAISHDENMKARFPQQIRIDMTENGSKVRRSA
jgi:exonuclease SbcC